MLIVKRTKGEVKQFFDTEKNCFIKQIFFASGEFSYENMFGGTDVDVIEQTLPLDMHQPRPSTFDMLVNLANMESQYKKICLEEIAKHAQKELKPIYFKSSFLLYNNYELTPDCFIVGVCSTGFILENQEITAGITEEVVKGMTVNQVIGMLMKLEEGDYLT